MKAFFLLLVSFLLVTAILTPSITTLIGADNDTPLVMDFSEEENKQGEKKEISEKDLFFHLNFIAVSSRHWQKPNSSSYYLEVDYSHSVDVFLPPPKFLA
ncbi:hypothetical protein FK220_005945 [Flavobacteriaceae bacterium TP-CH-4]|uniref:Uncharacterized protein n=1 Tax=Pelagihabitans pacificus TaxID=2696054 RepID=A0A967AWH6_9FLAO|nr:hypothetical protein [Pelagihabitans pacificus]NHF58872.1 hypothetical protein [Pelagihabitans pacificus]